jgi:glycosyltransferase involved in cell wall biosynthesis
VRPQDQEREPAGADRGGSHAAVLPSLSGVEGRQSKAVTLDIVVPMYNEAAVLPALLAALAETFAADVRARHRLAGVRVLLVDDGSQDDSVRLVREAVLPDLPVRVIRLSRNFGQQAAVSAGIAHSSAELVAVLDADLQDPPACVLDMVAKWREGYEVVYGQRQNRHENPLLVALYWLFYRVYRLLTPIRVPVDAGDFCLMSRRVVDELVKLPERLRFPRGLRAWIGFRQTAITYDRPPRFAGRSRYRLADLYGLATDGIASLSLRPLQLAQVLALLYFAVTMVAAVVFALGWPAGRDVETRLTLLLIVTMLSNGLVLLCLYIIGAYLGRAYLEVKGRPPYVVAEVLDTRRGIAE